MGEKREEKTSSKKSDNKSTNKKTNNKTDKKAAAKKQNPKKEIARIILMCIGFAICAVQLVLGIVLTVQVKNLKVLPTGLLVGIIVVFILISGKFKLTGDILIFCLSCLVCTHIKYENNIKLPNL